MSNESRSYAARNLTQVGFVLRSQDGLTPDVPHVRILGGLEFLKVSGSSKDRHVRLHPRCPAEFFRRTVSEELIAAGEDPAGLSAEEMAALSDAVASDYAAVCTRRVGSKGEPLSFLPLDPDGVPDLDWFSIVVPKPLWEEGGTLSPIGGGSGPRRAVTITADRIRAAIQALREKAAADKAGAGNADE